ncbi:hypothetical protein [Synechococcus sp. CBW1107]|uniref:hypothetical protein n=1 Tax=Synechococcus sp. CBW1107 TaxID=2789857 RepID=UPI002AD2F324|nr:hypothetical protein [Synechococcus sp. CBW1107]
MTATLTNANPAALGEPTPGSPEALLLLANAGVLPASTGTDDRVSPLTPSPPASPACSR